MEFKITFNRTAVRSFFEGEEAVGIRLRIRDGEVEFRPVDNLDGEDSAPLALRDRGGIAAIINGSEALDLLKCLKVTDGRPYFLLSKRKDGWITFQPYRLANNEPSRLVSYARIWLKNDVVIDHAMPIMNEADYKEDVRKAKTVLDAYHKKGRIGRPSEEVIRAQETLDDFRKFAFEIIPFDEIRSAYVTLGRFLSEAVSLPKTNERADGNDEIDQSVGSDEVDDEFTVQPPDVPETLPMRLRERA
jgi:hypothetical protein